MKTPSRATLAAVLFAGLFPTFATWLYFVVLPGGRWMLPAYAACKVLQFAFPLIWVLGVERGRPPKNLTPWPPLPSHTLPPGRGGTGAGLLAGLLSGLGFAAFLLILWKTLIAGGPLAARAAQAASAKLAGFGIETAVGYLLLAVFYSVLHSLLEEYYWRWFVFGQLARGCKLPSAIAISAVGFSAHHVLVLAHYFGHIDSVILHPPLPVSVIKMGTFPPILMR